MYCHPGLSAHALMCLPQCGCLGTCRSVPRDGLAYGLEPFSLALVWGKPTHFLTVELLLRTIFLEKRGFVAVCCFWGTWKLTRVSRLAMLHFGVATELRGQHHSLRAPRGIDW